MNLRIILLLSRQKLTVESSQLLHEINTNLKNKSLQNMPNIVYNNISYTFTKPYLSVYDDTITNCYKHNRIIQNKNDIITFMKNNNV